MNKVKIGIIGCGNISSIYLTNLSTMFEITEVSACADIILENAVKKAEEFNIKKACSVEELLRDPDIKIVLNLTTPNSHFEVSMAALEAGKNVYVEKPLALTREQGIKLINKAKEKGLLVGGAPDTFLGGGLQTCRKLIDEGWIGTPVAATAFMTCHGHESWHPAPDFYYKVGGGPMFDMGPYYLTALLSLMGPVAAVSGMTRKTFPQRTITSEPNYGKVIDVEVPTHVTGLLEFASGAIGTIITSFDVWDANLPYIEIYGSLGSLKVPDPNTFGGPVLIKIAGQAEWMEIPLTHGYTGNSRGVGVADMAYALLSGRDHRANVALTYHVLDIMHAIEDSSKEGKHIQLRSTLIRPSALPLGLLPGKLDK
ncbi:Gfo/Idh/MocA family oxidoreductase [Clostridium estertheticum]|uniref:Gfo/Idh/MocA family protein n=1 Tax=Clostridium estertheticum TaxID=238834 RepID=UPI0013E935BB|nr:Gfo/Idh/MocA family oxidoreductase [Clostridium estertheticum]MBZ9686015.1 Gfo/Idh/MocA family oxidoreductase [Clostridium estertheticum]